MEPEPLLCPSASADTADATAFGIAGGTPRHPQVLFLRRQRPVDEFDNLGGADPNEILRMAAPCAERACLHFDGTDCSLIRGIVHDRAPVTDTLPACAIRASCRWWRQNGRDACHRCPGVVTQIGLARS